ncbi:MAG: AAA family ATPase [Flavobacteriaceae bacterium]|nr:AAA family ATPase [Flavobacteriaceae bacterium]
MKFKKKCYSSKKINNVSCGKHKNINLFLKENIFYLYLYFTINNMESLRKRHTLLIEETNLTFKRYLLTQLPWQERLIGVKGSRGVGKTTLLLQYIKQEYGLSSKALYISLDDLYFSENRLIDFTEEFIAKGGEHLFIDEVHKYKNWSIELKNIFDIYSSLKVVFTGSSLLEILNSRSDLSRRALVYSMQGMSFREYLNINLKIELQSYELKYLLENHIEIALAITKQIKPLQYFEDYLKIGYFPFYAKNEELYFKRLQEIINMIIEVELPLLRNTDISISNKIKQLVYVISQSVPFKPNISALANKIQITRKTLLEYINSLHDASIFTALYKDSFGISLLQKPEKLFLENTNYMYAIKYTQPNIGNVRESFFLNQLSQNQQVTYPDKGDFLINNTYLFEVGGRTKTTKQLQGAKNSFIAADTIELGFENKIPLWLFGFLY